MDAMIANSEAAVGRNAHKDEDARWAALLSRNADRAGPFLYAVVTTGIYCRPTCKARRPLAKNVRFFDTRAAAEEAGFRPCKKCRPDLADDMTHSRHADLVRRACRMIERAEEAPDLATLAASAGLSPHHFHRVFKAVTGVTPKAYAAAHRMCAVQDRLSEGTPVTEALYDAGYGSSSRFYDGAEAMLGMAPARYRDGGAGVRIHYALADSVLGRTVVAASDRGLCAIAFGDDDAELIGQLKARFPKAELEGDDAGFRRWVDQVIAFLSAPAAGLDLPLDIQGTAFQRRVWQALRDIPPGETRSYAEVARAIGQPSASRAVARACATNQLAVAVPCHRVVRGDGDVSGYRWGVERKRALLEREAGV
jgi:AraC family transcriptional regulator of adaptative response/methylated-DNA-[protein]-cysteine methyltransferase